MGKRSLIISLFFLIVLSSFAYGSLISEWTLNNADTIGTDVVDIISGHNGTHTSLTTGREDCPANLDECYLFGASSDVGILNSDYWDFGSGAFFINFWYKTNNSAADNILFYNHKSIGGDALYRRIRTDTSEDYIAVRLYDGSGDVCTFGFGSSVDDGNWKHVLITGKNALTCTDSNLDAWYNGVNQTLTFVTTGTQDSVDTDDKIFLGAQDNGNLNLEGLMDDVCIGTEWITPENVSNLYNSSAGNPCNVALTLGGGGAPAPAGSTASFKINATDLYTTNKILSFNATVDGTNYATTNGSINTPLYINSSILHNVTTYAENYLTLQVADLNISTDYTPTLTLLGLYNLTLSNYSHLTGSGNYVRQLVGAYNYTCDSGSATQLVTYIGNAYNDTATLTCDNTTNSGSFGITQDYEGHFNISFIYNTTIGSDNTSLANISFFSDLYDPIVTNTSFLYGTDFVDPAANFSMHCNDTITPNLTYIMEFNGVTYADFLKPKLSQQFNSSTDLVDGYNNVTYTCKDYFGNDSTTTQTDINIRTLYIIDEQKNTGFDVQNLSSVIVYLDDNRTSYDFKTNAKQNISFVADANVKLRFELIYFDDTIILRYVDIGLLDDDIRVCANTEGITHYEQILTSSSSRPVVLKSVFADCLVAADYTRFAYQNSKVLKAYTYNNLYYLYTFVDDDITKNQIFLASVDGSIATYINLDSLEFFDAGYDIDAIGDGIAVNKLNANEMSIYYYNTLQDNTDLRIQIVRLDTDVTLYNVSTFADNDEVSITFNYAALANVNETTVFRVDAIATTANGETTTSKYFNINGVTGSVSAGLMFILSLIFYMFGLSFAATSKTFSYVGIVVMLINIGILSFATYAWYITFMQAINVITMIYIFFIMTSKNTAQIG